MIDNISEYCVLSEQTGFIKMETRTHAVQVSEFAFKSQEKCEWSEVK